MAELKNLRLRALQSRDAIELIADKWHIPILHVLCPSPLLSGELQKAMADVSPKVLTQTLRRMERDGLISRTVYSAVPPKVEYRITSMGKSLLGPLRQLCLWAKAHGKERDQSRQEFDRKQKKSDSAAPS